MVPEETAAIGPHPPEQKTGPIDLLLITILLAATAWLSLTLTRIPSSVASVWVTNGLLVGWLLSRPTSVWPRYLAAGLFSSLVARFLVGDSVPYALGLTFANLVEVLLVAGSVRRKVPDVGDPKLWLGLGQVATLSTLMACAVSGGLASAVAAVRTGMPLATFLVWYPSHVIGMVVVGTLTLVAHREGIRLLGRPGRRLDFAFSMLGIAIVVGAVFVQSSLPLLFLVFPPLLWMAYRHRFPGVLMGIALVTLISAIATGLGHGPIAQVQTVGNYGRTFLMQVFIGTACLMTYPVALIMAERSRLFGRLRESEFRYRLLADYTHDVVVRMRTDGQRLYVSPSSREILGWEPDELLKPNTILMHPDDLALQREVIAAVVASGDPITETYRLLHKDGNYVWIETVAQLIPSVERDGTMDIIYSGRDVSKRVIAEQLLKESRLELEQLARVDSLTGVANRRQFDERLALGVAKSRRHPFPITLLYIDIDHFKLINDSLGHAAGDAVLQQVAQRLTNGVRAGDLVARLGGDEFLILVEDAPSSQVAETIARKLINSMTVPVMVENVPIMATLSIGIAFSTSATDAAMLMSLGDKALYAAKEAGRNTYRLATTDRAPASPFDTVLVSRTG